MASTSPQAPMSQVLGACAVELADLNRLCVALQSALSAGFSPANLQDAQAFDLVTQSLAALSQYLGGLAAEAPSSWNSRSDRLGRRPAARKPGRSPGGGQDNNGGGGRTLPVR